MHLMRRHAFNFGKSEILWAGRELILYQTTNFLDCSRLKAFTDDIINLT